jgi:hypothetical protein
VKAQRSFLSGIRPSREQHGPQVKVTAPGIRLSREQHGPKVKVTAPPIKKTEVQNSRGFTIRYLVFSLVIVFLRGKENTAKIQTSLNKRDDLK